MLRRLDIGSLGVGIAFIARLRGGAAHPALSHTHCDLRDRTEKRERRRQRRRGAGLAGEDRKEAKYETKKEAQRRHAQPNHTRHKKHKVNRCSDQKEKPLKSK